jgi:hypothetical protein
MKPQRDPRLNLTGKGYCAHWLAGRLRERSSRLRSRGAQGSRAKRDQALSSSNAFASLRSRVPKPHARRRTATDCRLVVRSPLRDAGSLYRDRSIGIVTPSIASQPGVQAPWQHTASTAIPIASDAPPRPVSRGFLPWRFADAGPGARGTTIMGPASENLHRNGPGDPNAPRLFTTRSCHWRCLEKIIQGCRRRTASFVLR